MCVVHRSPSMAHECQLRVRVRIQHERKERPKVYVVVCVLLQGFKGFVLHNLWCVAFVCDRCGDRYGGIMWCVMCGECVCFRRASRVSCAGVRQLVRRWCWLRSAGRARRGACAGGRPARRPHAKRSHGERVFLDQAHFVFGGFGFHSMSPPNQDSPCGGMAMRPLCGFIDKLDGKSQYVCAPYLVYCRLKGALRRADVRSADELEEEEYSEAVRSSLFSGLTLFTHMLDSVWSCSWFT